MLSVRIRYHHTYRRHYREPLSGKWTPSQTQRKCNVPRLVGTFAIDLFASPPIGDSSSCSFKGTRTTHTTRSLESKIPFRAGANTVADADTKSRLMSKN